MRGTTFLHIAYQLGRVGVSMATFFPYAKWRTRIAKSAFKKELLRNGLPKELATILADSYDSGNKNILRSVFSRSKI